MLLAFVSGVTQHVFAYLMFGFGTFVVASVAQEFFRGARARRAMTGESPGGALIALVRRNRRRYGGYLVHAGVAVALVGVAGSTSFQHQRYATLRPGQSVHLDGYTLRYTHPTAQASAQKISFGADIAVTKAGHRVTTLHTSYGLYPSLDPMHPIGRFLNTSDGVQTESRVGLDSGALRDLWVVISPNLGPLQSLVSQGDLKFGRAILAAENQPPAQRASQLNTIFQLRDVFINDVAQRFVSPPVGLDVPDRGLAARHVAVDRRHHRRARRPHRPVAGAAPLAPRRAVRAPPGPAGDARDLAGPDPRTRARARAGLTVAYALVLVVLAGVIYLISSPLRAAHRREDTRSAAADVAELEAERDAKYREIRDAELDVRTGKLSDEDYAALDGSLRAEAVDILHQLDEARSHEQIPSGP